MSKNIDDAIDMFVRIRDKKKELQDDHKEQLKPFNEGLKKLEAILIDHLNNSGAESIRGTHGTVYSITRTSAKVDNWDDVLQYILDNELYHMLEKRVSKGAVEEYVEANGEPPPGVAITSDATVGVRRA